MSDGTPYYRYDDSHWADATSIPLTTYYLVKKTKCGFWVRHELDYEGDKLHFVLNGVDGKRLCYPTKELALKSYLKRKARHIMLLNHQLTKAKRMEDIAKSLAIGPFSS